MFTIVGSKGIPLPLRGNFVIARNTGEELMTPGRWGLKLFSRETLANLMSFPEEDYLPIDKILPVIICYL